MAITAAQVKELRDTSGAGMMDGAGMGMNTSGMQGADNEESFFDLLKTFSKLEFPDNGVDVPEQCPLCPDQFSIDEFATHVYKCIKKLVRLLCFALFCSGCFRVGYFYCFCVVIAAMFARVF